MKILFVFFILFIIMLSTTSCRGDGRMGRRQENNIDLIQLNYFVSFWRFGTHLVWDSTMWFNANNTRNREIIFVYSEEAAAVHGFPLDKIIAWPSPYTLGKLNALNNMEFDIERMQENGVCLDALNISLPITPEDLINNWENINIFLGNGLTVDERSALNIHARINYQTKKFDDQALRHLLFPGALEAINEIITGRDMNNVDIERFNRLRGTEFTINDLPVPPFSEEDVRSNPRLIQTIVGGLLNGIETRSIQPEAILRRQAEQND